MGQIHLSLSIAAEQYVRVQSERSGVSRTQVIEALIGYAALHGLEVRPTLAVAVRGAPDPA